MVSQDQVLASKAEGTVERLHLDPSWYQMSNGDWVRLGHQPLLPSAIVFDRDDFEVC